MPLSEAGPAAPGRHRAGGENRDCSGAGDFKGEARKIAGLAFDPARRHGQSSLFLATFGEIPALLGRGAKPRKPLEEVTMSEDTTRFRHVIGNAALTLWPDLPREVQERLFESAVGDEEALRHQLALYLHDHHPRTAHPPKPTALA